MRSELTPTDRVAFLPVGVRTSLGRVGLRELRRVGLVSAEGLTTLGGLALSEGLGGVQLRRYGLPVSVVEQNASLHAVHEHLHSGPWPLLVEALPWTFGLGVAEEVRRDHRLLLARLLVLAFGQRELVGLGGPVVVDRCQPGWRISWPGEAPSLDSGPANPQVASVLAQLVEDSDPRDLEVLAADLGYRLDTRAEAGGACVVLWRDQDRVAKMSSRRTRLTREQRHKRILEALRVELSRPMRGDRFSLRQPGGGKVDSTTSRGRTLTFELPDEELQASPRLYVVHDASNLALPRRFGGGEPYVVENPYWTRWLACRDALSAAASRADPGQLDQACRGARGLASAKASGDRVVAIELERRDQAGVVEGALAQLRSDQRVLSASLRDQQAAEDWLAGSDAYVGGVCVRPPEGSLPGRDLRACEPDTSEDFALAVCGVIELGAGGVPMTGWDGCGELADVARSNDMHWAADVTDLAGSPVCTASLNAYFGRTDSFEEAVVDFGLSIFEDQAVDFALDVSDWLDSVGWDGAADAVRGSVITWTAVQFDSCVSEIEDACLGFYDDWRADVAAVKSRPEVQRRKCQERVSRRPSLRREIEAQREVVRASTELLKEESEWLTAIESRLEGAQAELDATLLAARPGSMSRLRASSSASGVRGITLADWRRRAVFGGRAEQEIWNGLGIGAGAAALSHPDLLAQGVAESAPPTLGVDLIAHWTVLPFRFSTDLRGGSVTLEGVEYTAIDDEVEFVDKVKISHTVFTGRLEVIPVRTDWMLVTAGFGVGQYDTNLNATFSGARGQEAVYFAPRASLVLSPPERAVQLQAYGEKTWMPLYGSGWVAGASLHGAGLRLGDR